MNTAQTVSSTTLSREERVQRYGDVLCRLNVVLVAANLYNILELSRLTGVDYRILRDLRENAEAREHYGTEVFARLCRVLGVPLRNLLVYYTPEQLASGKVNELVLPATRLLDAPPIDYGHIRCVLPQLMRDWEKEHGSAKLSNKQWSQKLGINVETVSRWIKQQTTGYKRYSLAQCCHFFKLGEDGVERILQYDPPSSLSATEQIQAT